MKRKSLEIIGITSAFWIFVMSCSSISGVSHRSYGNRAYYACGEIEAKRAGIKSRLGKLCYSYCKKHKFLSSQCKEYATLFIDLNKPEEYGKFYAAEMTCVSIIGDNI